MIEAEDTDADAIVEESREEGATNFDADGDEIFWIVFADKPRSVEAFTERALRSTIGRRTRQ